MNRCSSQREILSSFHHGNESLLPRPQGLLRPSAAAARLLFRPPRASSARAPPSPPSAMLLHKKTRRQSRSMNMPAIGNTSCDSCCRMLS